MAKMCVLGCGNQWEKSIHFWSKKLKNSKRYKKSLFSDELTHTKTPTNNRPCV